MRGSVLLSRLPHQVVGVAQRQLRAAALDRLRRPSSPLDRQAPAPNAVTRARHGGDPHPVTVEDGGDQQERRARDEHQTAPPLAPSSCHAGNAGLISPET